MKPYWLVDPLSRYNTWKMYLEAEVLLLAPVLLVLYLTNLLFKIPPLTRAMDALENFFGKTGTPIVLISCLIIIAALLTTLSNERRALRLYMWLERWNPVRKLLSPKQR